AQSLDLNLIEAPWLDLENKLEETWGRVGDIPILEATLKVVWIAIPNEQREALIRSMPQCLQAVIMADRGPTQY
ncbi:hypothetical protein HOY82DRAFT_482620, partial [Tuber indicum]